MRGSSARVGATLHPFPQREQGEWRALPWSRPTGQRHCPRKPRKAPPRRANDRGHGPRSASSMSIEQRNATRVITVGREAGAVVRDQSLAVLEHNHEYFEELRRFGPEARRALAAIYRDAFAVLDA